jgi:hypothetical protein
MKSALLRLIIVTFAFVFSLSVAAQESEVDDNSFGGWEFIEVSYLFKNSGWFTSFYFEHDNYQYKRLECWYTRFTLGYKINSWLKTDVAYDFMQEPTHITHRGIYDITATLKQGNLSISLRERFVYSWSPSISKQSNVLRSRIKTQYFIPNSRFSPYLAVELFTWDVWKKTRHYVATTYRINDYLEIEGYYLYYTFATSPAEHVLGIGLNMEF